MKNVKYFDVHDLDVTPAIYTLLFSGVVVELTGNDTVYDITNWYENHNPDEDFNDVHEQLWEERLKRGSNNCYFDKEAMESFIKNPCTVNGAMHEFAKWTVDNGVTEDDILLVKIWW